MGHSSSRKRRGENVAEAFQLLQEILGDWFVDELIFRAPNTEPVMNTGRTTCRSVIGLAVVAINEIPSGDRTVALITFNPRDERYEVALVDTLSDVGVTPMMGQLLMIRSSEEIRAQFGKAAMAIREWTLVQPPAGLPETAIVRVVENKISNDRWVIQFFARGSQGEFLVRQQVLTRVQPGCAAQPGCELGCAGLVGCVQGCEGLQSTNGVPRGQAELLAQAQQLALTQLPGEAELLGQAQRTVRAQCGCLQPPKTLQPPKCPTQAVPPPPPKHGGHHPHPPGRGK